MVVISSQAIGPSEAAEPGHRTQRGGRAGSRVALPPELWAVPEAESRLSRVATEGPRKPQVIAAGQDGAVASGLRTVLERALDVALPPTCAGCGVEGELLCASCRPELERRLERPGGVPIGMIADIPEPLLQLEWCAPFVGAVRAALHALKYGGERRLAGPLGSALATRWQHAGTIGDTVVPVPVHAGRLRERGYDQAVLLARVAAQHLELPFAPILERHRATERQFDLDRRSRAGNVAGAFRLVPGASTQAPLEGRWIILIDDVVTTGNTLVACANALLQGGALGVSALTVARER
jgi:ComF family protein